MVLEKELNKALETIASIKKKIADKILALPENTRIKKLGKNCFVIQSKDLNNTSWSPEYYQFAHQYKMLADIVNCTETAYIIKRLQTIAEKGKVVLHETTYKFHPTVITYLKEILA